MIAKEGTDYCNLSIVQEVLQMMELLKGGYDSVLFTGHSLGGTSAFCLSKRFPDSRCVVFNPGAAPTNPIISGPGASRATVYHIVGDIISSHMSSKAALVFRIKLQVPFGSVKAHATENFFSSGSYSLMTATQEDELFLKWAKGTNVTGAIYANYSKYLQTQAKFNPIPDSARDINKADYDEKGNKKSKSKLVNSFKSFLYKTGIA